MIKCIRSNHPETSIGLPGSQQGLNTGVGLLHLSRMRESEELNKYLRSEEMDKLAEKFMFVGALGHQVSMNLWILLINFVPKDIKHMKKCRLHQIRNIWVCNCIKCLIKDWWNLVSWDRPELKHNLACNYNKQVETEYKQGPWLQTFHLFHECPGDIKILHGYNI